VSGVDEAYVERHQLACIAPSIHPYPPIQKHRQHNIQSLISVSNVSNVSLCYRAACDMTFQSLETLLQSSSFKWCPRSLQPRCRRSCRPHAHTAAAALMPTLRTRPRYRRSKEKRRAKTFMTGNLRRCVHAPAWLATRAPRSTGHMQKAAAVHPCGGTGAWSSSRAWSCRMIPLRPAPLNYATHTRPSRGAYPGSTWLASQLRADSSR
jgi:hypothetical protein